MSKQKMKTKKKKHKKTIYQPYNCYCKWERSEYMLEGEEGVSEEQMGDCYYSGLISFILKKKKKVSNMLLLSCMPWKQLYVPEQTLHKLMTILLKIPL